MSATQYIARFDMLTEYQQDIDPRSEDDSSELSPYGELWCLLVLAIVVFFFLRLGFITM